LIFRFGVPAGFQPMAGLCFVVFFSFFLIILLMRLSCAFICPFGNSGRLSLGAACVFFPRRVPRRCGFGPLFLRRVGGLSGSLRSDALLA